jgi:phosphoglycerate kinase
LPDTTVRLVKDFHEKEVFEKQTEREIILVENIRFFPGEQENYPAFAKELSMLGDIYVNDAFSVSHRDAASVVGLPHLLPSFGGLLLKKEVETLTKALKDPKEPFVAILGGAKVSSKIHLITRLIEVADIILIGGGMANTFFRAAGLEIGKSFYEPAALAQAKKLLVSAEKHHTELVLPQDVIVGDGFTATEALTKRLGEIEAKDQILDIGPETEALFGSKIAEAKTIVWNGPVGYFENPTFRHGTDFLYYAISENAEALSIIGGGETLAAVSKKEHLEKISHISTGGGAMLEFMENGTLPGIEALER